MTNPAPTIHEGQIIIISRDNPPRVVTTLTATRPFNHQQVVHEFITMVRARSRLGVRGPNTREFYSTDSTDRVVTTTGDDNEFIEWLISMGYVTPTPTAHVIEWHISQYYGVALDGGTLRPLGSWRPYYCAECGQGCFPEERVRVYGNPNLTAMRRQNERDLCKPCFQKISAEHANSQRPVQPFHK